MTLADILWRQEGVDFALAHCNFHLRGEESDGDAEFVRNWAAERGVRSHCIDFDTKAYAASRKISIEMAARELRYGWFALLCREYGYGAVAIAHNANDNAETLILNLVRGTGLRGICGMQEMSVQTVSPDLGSAVSAAAELAAAIGCDKADFPETLNIWRPLLGMTRPQIEGYARRHGLKWREDRTNRDSEYKRNLVRNEIIPLLERLNPSAVKTLNRDMGYFSEARRIVDDCFGGDDQEPGDGCQKNSSGGSPADFREGFPADGSECPVECARDSRLVRRIVSKGRGWRYALYLFLEKYSFSGAVIAQVEDLLDSDRTVSGKIFYSPTHHLIMTSSSFIVEQLKRSASGEDSSVNCCVSDGCDASAGSSCPEAGCPEAGSSSGSGGGAVVVTGPGEIDFNGSRISVELFDRDDGFNPKQPDGVTAIDADKAPFPLTLRPWRHGDWMRLLGCRGKKKISNLFTDLKFSLPEKRSAILLECPSAVPSGRVLALIGLRIDESVRITPETRRILRFTLR